MYDFIIKNVRIIDGTGAPWFRGSVAVKGGRIAAVLPVFSERTDENLSGETEVIDGEDLYLAPGFIDIHSHSDTTLPLYPRAESRVLQGITTEIGGDCGISAAPVSPDPAKKKLLADYVGDLPYTWKTVGEYLDYVEAQHPSVNFGTSVGHGTIRLAAMGFDNRKTSPEEMEEMKELLRGALEDGAFCLSSGLIYPPGCYADTDELAELAGELIPYGAYYKTHMRNEGAQIVSALEEALEVCRRSGAPLQINHHKIINKDGWEFLCKTTIAMIQKARREGFDVTCDQYPYQASSTTLDSNLPQWAYEGGVEALIHRLEDPKTREEIKKQANASHVGRWGDIYVSCAKSEKNRWTVGKSIEEIAKLENRDPADVCIDLIVDEKGRVNEVNYGMCEEDIEYIMSQPFTMIGSDGSSLPLDYEGQPHPRAYGTFPRVIAHYCRDRKLFPLETAVFKMTGLPAARLKLSDRGLLKPGMWADLVLFDFKTIEDTPSYSVPNQPCAGIRKVFVNGVLTAADGKHTGAASGQVLRRK